MGDDARERTAGNNGDPARTGGSGRSGDAKKGSQGKGKQKKITAGTVAGGAAGGFVAARRKPLQPKGKQRHGPVAKQRLRPSDRNAAGAKVKRRYGTKQPRSARKALRTLFGVRYGYKAVQALKRGKKLEAARNGVKAFIGGIRYYLIAGGCLMTVMMIGLTIGIVALIRLQQPAKVAAMSAMVSASELQVGELDIPDNYLIAYQAAVARPDVKAKCPNLPWQFVAAVGSIETDHGASTLPGVHSGLSLYEDGTIAGAAGPMQIGYDPDPADGIEYPAGNAWARYGVDGDNDEVADVYNYADAIPAAAVILCDDWLRWDPKHSVDTLWKAAFAYNQGPNKEPVESIDYVQKVMAKYAEYQAASSGSTGPWVVDGNAGPLPGHASIPPPPKPFLKTPSTACSFEDPTGGRCLTETTNHAYAQIRAAFGNRFKYFHCQSERQPTASGYVGEHPKGQACDLGPGTIGRYPSAQELQTGWALAGWLRANAGALKVWYVIWQGRIWNVKYSTPDVGGQWGHPYTGIRGGGITSMHYDHVHVSFLPVRND